MPSLYATMQQAEDGYRARIAELEAELAKRGREFEGAAEDWALKFLNARKEARKWKLIAEERKRQLEQLAELERFPIEMVNAVTRAKTQEQLVSQAVFKERELCAQQLEKAAADADSWNHEDHGAGLREAAKILRSRR